MKELKNVLVSLILILCMSFVIYPSIAFAQDEEGLDNIAEEYIEQYVEQQEGTITIHFIDETGKNKNGQYDNQVDPNSSEYYEDENISKNDRELAKPIIISGFEEGEEFNLEKHAKETLEKLTIKNYVCVNGDNPLRGTFILDNENNNMDVGLYFEYQPYTLTLNFLEKGTDKSIANSEVYTYKDGEKFNFKETDPQEIKGYKFIEMTGELIGNIEGVSEERVNDEVIQQRSKIINIYYEPIEQEQEISNKYRVIINYLEKGTNKVLAPQFISIKVEDKFSYNVKSREVIKIPDYKHVKTVGNVKGVIKDKDVVINVYYKKTKKYIVTVNYINKENKSIIKPYVSSPMDEGSNYDVTNYNDIKIKGYNYYKTSGDSLKGILNSDKIINVYYMKYGEEAAKTGDDNNLILWVGIAILAIAMIFILKKIK